MGVTMRECARCAAKASHTILSCEKSSMNVMSGRSRRRPIGRGSVLLLVFAACLGCGVLLRHRAADRSQDGLGPAIDGYGLPGGRGSGASDGARDGRGRGVGRPCWRYGLGFADALAGATGSIRGRADWRDGFVVEGRRYGGGGDWYWRSMARRDLRRRASSASKPRSTGR